MPNLGGINTRFKRRGLIYCDPGLARALAGIYGLKAEELRLAEPAGPVSAFRVSRPGASRVILAPFNFQPVLALRNEQIVREIVRLAEQGPAGTTARIKLHHSLPDSIIAELGLSSSVDGVETLVSLEGGREAVMARMRPRHRSKLRAVRRGCDEAGLDIVRFGDDERLEAFYRIMVAAYRDKHAMLPQPLSLFRTLCRHEAGRRRAFGYAAVDRASGKMAGGVIVLQDEEQWCYGWGANRSACASLEIGTHLIGHALEEAIAAGAAVFSLGMSSASQEDLRRYKRGWGGEEHDVLTYGWREQVHSIDLHRDFALAREVLRRMPVSVIRAVSPLAVKWLV